MSKTIKQPQRGEIWLVKFKKSKEAPKTYRPALVISGNVQNELNDLIVVVPLTTDNIEVVEPFEIYIENTKETGLNEPSKVQFIYPFTIDTNPTLKKLTDINQNTYYLLVNPDNPDDAYFCFSKTVVAGWSDLEQAAEQNTNLSQVTLEYQESAKGMRVYRQVLRVEINY